MKDENIDRILSGELILKSHHTVSDFTPGQLKRLQTEYDKADYLTVVECCIWLGLSRRTIYKMIKAGKISVFRVTCTNQGPYKINVKETKRILNMD